MNESAYALFQQIKKAFRLGDFPPFTTTQQTPDLTGGWMWDCVGLYDTREVPAEMRIGGFPILKNLALPYYQPASGNNNTHVYQQFVNTNASSWVYRGPPLGVGINEESGASVFCPITLFSKLQATFAAIFAVWSDFERAPVGRPVPYSQRGYFTAENDESLPFLTPFLRIDVPLSVALQDGRLLDSGLVRFSPYWMFDKGASDVIGNRYRTAPKTMPFSSETGINKFVYGWELSDTPPGHPITCSILQATTPGLSSVLSLSRFLFVKEIGGVPYVYSLKFVCHPHLKRLDGDSPIPRDSLLYTGFAIRVIPTFGEDH